MSTVIDIRTTLAMDPDMFTYQQDLRSATTCSAFLTINSNICTTTSVPPLSQEILLMLCSSLIRRAVHMILSKVLIWGIGIMMVNIVLFLMVK